MVLEVIFWILLILSIISACLPDSVPYAVRGRYVIALILVFILGLKVFGNFMSK